MSVLSATRRSIAAATAAGMLDKELAAGPIEVLLGLARMIDRPGFPVIDGRFDNTSAALYSKFATSLGLLRGSSALPPSEAQRSTTVLRLLRAEANPPGTRRTS